MKKSIKSNVLFVFSLLFGVMFINSGLNKFFNYMPMPEHLPEKMAKALAAFMEIGWLLPLVGVAEVVGGLLIIIPKTRALGALIMVPVMVGIDLTNLIQSPQNLPMVAILTVILGWVIYEERAKYTPLIK